MNTKLKNKALLLGLLIAATGHAGLEDENTSEEGRRLSRSAPSSPQRPALAARNGRPVEDGGAPLKLSALSALRAQVQTEAGSPTSSTTTASGRTASVAATHLTAGTMFTAGSAMTAEGTRMFVGQNVSLQQRLEAVDSELKKSQGQAGKIAGANKASTRCISFHCS